MRWGRIASMEWEHLDMVDGVWNVPDTKGGEPETLPLSRPVLEILTKRFRKRTGRWVFPGNGKKGHMVDLRRPWTAIRKAAGIPTKGANALHLHDLRRTMGSIQVNEGVGLAITSKTLLHKNIETTRKIYTIIDHEPMRDAVNLAADAMKELGNGEFSTTGKKDIEDEPAEA